MLSISTIKVGTKLVHKGDPWEVTSAAHNKQGRGGAILNTKLRNLKTGGVISQTFLGKDSVPEADLEQTKAQYLYKEGNQYNFMDKESYEQFTLTETQLGPKADYLIDGTNIDILKFEEEPINIDLPVKIAMTVTEAPPGVRGDTAQGGTKQVTLETDKQISTPLFIKEGDRILVDTRDGSYVEKAK